MKYIQLKDVCDLKNGYAFKSQDYVEKSNTLNCRMSNIRPGAIFDINYSPKYLPDEFAEKYNEFLLYDGDIVIAMTDLAGDPKILGVPAEVSTYGQNVLLNQRVGKLIIKNKKEIYYEYLKYALSNPKNKEYYKKFAGGGLQLNISKDDLLKIKIPIYEYEMQKEIANKFNKISEVIKIRKEQIENLEQLVKSQFVEMFKCKNYEKKRIGDFGKFQGGYAFKSKDFSENGIKLVQISNVNKDNLDWNEINRLPEEYIEKYKDYALNVGDVVMAMTRPIIKSLNEVKIAYVSENDVPCLLNQRVGRFLIDENKISKSYLTYCCKMDDFKNYVEKMSGNSLQPNISSKQVEDYTIEIPPIEEQNKFAEFVKLIDKQKFVIVEIIMFYDIILRSILNNIMG